MGTKAQNEKAALLQKISNELDLIRPFLQADEGDVTLEEVTDDFIVKVRLWGACCSCSMSTMTMKAGLEEGLKRAIPQIKAVVATNIKT